MRGTLVRTFRIHLRATALALALLVGVLGGASAALAAVNSTAPTSTVKLVFIHHSTGQAWLESGLGTSLGANNYFVSDTNYGWGPSGIGDHTDIGDWWTWFRGPSSSTYLTSLYGESGTHSTYSRPMANPGGENTIVMFKSCFPNSNVGGSPSDAIPPIGSNPLKGSGMSNLTVGNAKGVYLDLLEYFKTQPDRLFVLVVSPPLRSADTNADAAANARALANWLVDPNGLLRDYTGHNVFVFDFYTVLTGGHHRIVGDDVEHSAGLTNYLIYPTGDSHPSEAGNDAATAEFVPMLNAAYNLWRAGEDATPQPTMERRTGTLSTPSAGKTRLSRKRYYKWTGTLTPAQIGKSMVRLDVQRRIGGKWRTYKRYNATVADGATKWSVTIRIKTRGSYRVRAVHSDGDHWWTQSSWRKFSVR